MEGATLTARRLYRLLNAGSGNTSTPIPLLKKSLRITQTDFWWCFLSAGNRLVALNLANDKQKTYFFSGLYYRRTEKKTYYIESDEIYVKSGMERQGPKDK